MNDSDQSKSGSSADISALRERVAQLEQQHSGQVSALMEDTQLIADAATAWLELPSEPEIYASLAAHLQRIVGDDVIISVSELGEHTAHFSPKAIVGLGPLIEKASSLLGRHPIDIAGGFPASVRAAMANGRLVRIEGGVTELAGDLVPPSICRQLVQLMGLADLFVVGFAWGRFAGGICFVTRRPNMILRQGTIEALVRMAAAAIERKRSAELAQLQAIKLDLALSAAEIGAWEIELVTGKRHFDARVCGLLGIERATFGGTKEEFYRAVHPDDQEGLRFALRRTIDEGTPYAVEYRAVWPDGSVHWLSGRGTRLYGAEGRPTVINGMLWDITASKQADQALSHASVFLDSIVENVPIMLFLKDAQELRFVRVNRAGEELMGHSRADLIGKNDYDVFPQEQADFFSAKDREVLEGGKVVDIPEEPLQSKDQGQRILHTKKVPILGPTGEPQYLLGISEDITERKLAEQANLERLDELRRWHEVTLGRETRVIELKHEVNELLGKLDQPVRYTSVEREGTE